MADEQRKAPGIIVQSIEIDVDEVRSKILMPGIYVVAADHRTTDRSSGRSVDFTWRTGQIGFMPPDVAAEVEYHHRGGAVKYVGIPANFFYRVAPTIKDRWDITRGKNDELVRSIVHALMEAEHQGDPLTTDYLGLALARAVAKWFGPTVYEKNCAKQINLKRVIGYINDNLQRTITLRDLAAIANVSEFHFLRQFHRIVGRTPQDYVRDQRVECAKAALAAGLKPMSLIALDCGFADQSHMSRVFKERTGLTPGQFRRR